jgi:hypothetical protein
MSMCFFIFSTLLVFFAQHTMMVLIMLLAPKTVDYFKNVFICFGIVTIAVWWSCICSDAA